MKLLPDWGHVRSRPQHNPYHRFTVDRHLVEAASECRRADPYCRPAGSAAGRHVAARHRQGSARRPQRRRRRSGRTYRHRRWASTPSDVAALVTIARHHLLLPDTATRRDLEDPATAEFVASEVSDPEVIDLLAAVAEADGRATGPTAWSPWKAQLVAELARRVKAVLAGAAGTDAGRDRARQVSPEQERLLQRSPELVVTDRAGRARRGSSSATGPDRVGSDGRRDRRGGVAPARRAACLRRRLRASGAHRTLGAATPRRRAAATRATCRDVEAALSGDGRPLAERLAERARAYPTRRRGLPPAPPEVRFEDRLGRLDGRGGPRPGRSRSAAPHCRSARRCGPRHPHGHRLDDRCRRRRLVLRAHARRVRSQDARCT